MKRWFYGAISIVCMFLFAYLVIIPNLPGNASSIPGQSGNGAMPEEDLWEQSITGYIVDKENERILVLEGIEKEELEGFDPKNIHEYPSSGAYWFKVDSVDTYKIGQKVEVWPKGAIAESYPAQGTAGKINILEEAD
ncbi:YobA family protein [Alkalihalobacillus sp. TS-13]|uniref:YobA family protein n=1 Tax=Alkalihalobacillus sp. TS-13 TaxID=2842455 RepID=UPI001C88D011|nr:YobA family protein [Alkalihalobacillus sp. TS-13]